MIDDLDSLGEHYSRAEVEFWKKKAARAEHYVLIWAFVAWAWFMLAFALSLMLLR